MKERSTQSSTLSLPVYYNPFVKNCTAELVREYLSTIYSPFFSIYLFSAFKQYKSVFLT